MSREKVVIMGAAGRDFHNFNVYFRENRDYEVVAFTAIQIPNIDSRTYPPELSGKLYPNGIPIYPESDLQTIVEKFDVDKAVFAYSDVSQSYVIKKAMWVLSMGIDFMLMGPKSTMLKANRPVISVCAVRTGSGKSQTTSRVCEYLKELGVRVVIVRHPMPYGNLSKQAIQRYQTIADLDRYECTIEEREEYEQHIERGMVVYAGVDYLKILEMAEAEAQVIVWDGGNNDFSFYKPDLSIVVVDPLRPGNEVSYYPGEVNLRTADVIVINKVDSARPQDMEMVRNNIAQVNPDAVVIEATSPIFVSDGEKIRGKRVLVVEDGPTLTHGEMKFGAGVVAARKFGAGEVVDPRPFLSGSLIDTFKDYPDIGALLPCMGYGSKQIRDLEKTIKRSDAEVVIIATPIDLNKLIKINKETVRVRYELGEEASEKLRSVVEKFILS
ncbi:MAG: cyclic 2,3-diphosphoglycerate synthase [Actinobacteria bacterium]|nr:cyclic 2,3-diphosphoglycerate synthase [Actinomycetota bacterium]